MLRVVLDKPTGTIRPEEVTKDMLVVVKERCSGKLAKLSEIGFGTGKYVWVGFSAAMWCNPMARVFNSIGEAMSTGRERGDEIWVQRAPYSLSELADWIARECGEKGGETETVPAISAPTWLFCKFCDHERVHGTNEPCQSCRIARPTNFKPKG